jgi:hypothetical protein
MPRVARCRRAEGRRQPGWRPARTASASAIKCDAERRDEDQPPMHLASLSEGLFPYVTSHTTVLSKPRAVEGGAIVEAR